MYDSRRVIIQVFIVGISLLFIGKLFYLQLLEDNYKTAANNNALLKEIEYPYRGLVYDRKGKEMVYNVPVYDLLVTPKEVSKTMDTMRFCNLLGISKDDFKSKMLEAKTYSRVKPSAFLKQISNEDFARIQDQFIDFPGFRISPRTVRAYPSPSLANALGYIGEISKARLDKFAKQGNFYYKTGDYIGIAGLEKSYEELLRGKRGVNYIMVDVHGVKRGKFKNGAFDTASVKGENLISGIDYELQKYGEKLMWNKAGSVVAIEPSTGEILAFISAPSYDPAMLTGREFPKNYRRLALDSSKPLFNRPLMAMYPPGSIFKLLQALIGMQEGVIDSGTVFPCSQTVVKCHKHPSPQRLKGAVQYSCNPYFLGVYRKIINQEKDANTWKDTRIGYEKWREYVLRFGVGQPLGVDVPNEKKGILPTYKYFDKVYGANRWKFSNIYSMSIGQGELGIVPLQMANIAAILANRGWYYTPHFIKGIGDKAIVPEQFKVRHETGIKKEYYELVVEGMKNAVERGTVWSKARLKGIEICGKTGTAQNPHGEDHSVFICFAPKENPKIAMAVFVENAGFGGLNAAPIASLMIEKYLNDTISTSRKEFEQLIISKRRIGKNFN